MGVIFTSPPSRLSSVKYQWHGVLRAFRMFLEISKKNPLISQKVAQKLLKESQKFLFVAKVAQKLFKKIVPWFVQTVCCR